MKISLTKQIDENEHVPFKRDIEKLEIKPDSHVQFCNYDWIAIQKDSDLTLYKDGLTTSNDIDLTHLFGKAQCGKVQVYFFQFADERQDQYQMLLIGNSIKLLYKDSIVTYDVQQQRHICKFTLNDDLRVRRKLQFQKVEIFQIENSYLYILTDRFELINLDISTSDSRFNSNPLVRKRNFISNLLQTNLVDVYVSDANFKFIVVHDKVIIVQQISENQLKTYVCQLNPYQLINQSQKTFLCEINHVKYSTSINNFILQEIQNEVSLCLLAIVESQEFNERVCYVKLIQQNISFTDENQNDAQYGDLNQFTLNTRQQIKSQLFMNNKNLSAIYSVHNINYFHRDIKSHSNEIQQFSGTLQGAGVSLNQNLSILKVCSNGKIYILGQQQQEKTQQIITHFKERCMNEIILNLLNEGFKYYSNNSNQNIQFVKLEFQAYTEQIICQVINQMVWDFMETPIQKYLDVNNQLLEKKVKLEKWKSYTITVVKNQQILLNILRSMICLEIGCYINQNQQNLQKLINNCLDEWQIQRSFEYQFYSKLDDLYTIIEKLSIIEDYQNHLVNILFIIYKNIDELKKQNQILYPKFWTNEYEWLTLIQHVLDQLQNCKNIDFGQLFYYVVQDISTTLPLEKQINDEQFIIIQKFSEIINEDSFQNILLENGLYIILFQCYLQSKLKFNKIFKIIQNDNEKCQLFIDLCLEQEESNEYITRNKKRLHQILDDIEENNCVDQVLNCVKQYPKLHNIIAIRSMKLEQMENQQVILQGSCQNAKYYRFLVDTGTHIVNQTQNQIEIEQ